jgi:ferredoxin
MESDNRVSIDFMGKTYKVSKDLSLLGALLEIGWDSVKDLGCMGGCCGACATFYRLPDETHVKAGLACRTPVTEGISFAFVGHYHSPKPDYDVSEISNPKQALFDFFPEVTTCRNCEICPQVCPQGINPMKGMWFATFGDFATVAEMFKSCVQCGLCARVCSMGIRPHLVAMYASRMHGARLMDLPENLLDRMAQIQSGTYQEEWDTILQQQVEPTDEALD